MKPWTKFVIYICLILVLGVGYYVDAETSGWNDGPSVDGADITPASVTTDTLIVNLTSSFNGNATLADNKTIIFGTTDPAAISNMAQAGQSNWAIGIAPPASNIMAITTLTNSMRDHGIANQTDPYFGVWSATDVSGNTLQRISLRHDKTDGYVETETGDLVLEPAAASAVVVGSTIESYGDNITVIPGTTGYFRIGDEDVPDKITGAGDEFFVSGESEFDAPVFFDSSITVNAGVDLEGTGGIVISGGTDQDYTIFSLPNVSGTPNCFWDESGSEFECNVFWRAGGFKTAGDVSAARVITTLVSHGNSTIQLQIDNNGDEDGGGIQMLDDDTIYADHAVDGATYEINAPAGDIELNAKAGSAIVLAGETIKGTGDQWGFTDPASANQACITTCGSNTCVMGLDNAGPSFVDCADAAADSCMCTQ